MTEEAAEIVLDERVGLLKMKEILVMNGQDVSRRDLREFMIENEWMQAKGTPKPSKKRCAYAALATDAVWHTDLHEFFDQSRGVRLYIIAFIDDASRRIMGLRVLADKKAATTKKALEDILDYHQFTFGS
jgi:transposase InsO family protein